MTHRTIGLDLAQGTDLSGLVLRYPAEVGVHECNAYCQPNDRIHAEVLYHRTPLEESDVALVLKRGRVIDILERRPAPEAPAVCPRAPEQGEWPYRTLIIGRARRGRA